MLVGAILPRQSARYDAAPYPRATSPRRRLPPGKKLETLGPVFVRAAVGHGARGLLGEWRCLELFHPRPGALAHLSLGRGRPARHHRPGVPVVLQSGALEWARSILEGAHFRPG